MARRAERWPAVRLELIACIGLACGCATARPVVQTAGRSDDVHSPAGERIGYRVVRTCAVDGTANHIGIVGTGSGHVAAVANIDRLVEGWCAGISSCWARGYGYSCTGERMAIHVYISDWRDVDRAIDRIGAELHDGQLGDEVLIIVEPKQEAVRHSALVARVPF
jgi:hypothetical protein